jgi:hypothetical protein
VLASAVSAEPLALSALPFAAEVIDSSRMDYVQIGMAVSVSTPVMLIEVPINHSRLKPSADSYA